MMRPGRQSLHISAKIMKNSDMTNGNAGEGMWAVQLKESGEGNGCVGYLPASSSNLQIAPDECEVGYWIARPVRVMKLKK